MPSVSLQLVRSRPKTNRYFQIIGEGGVVSQRPNKWNYSQHIFPTIRFGTIRPRLTLRVVI